MLVPADKESAQKLYELEGVGCIFPLDQKLGIDTAPFKATYRMVADIAWEGISCRSYREAAARLSKSNNYSISHAQVKAVTDYVGKLVFADDSRRAEEAKLFDVKKVDKRREKNDTIYVEFDGSFYSELTEGESGCEWKECKIGICFKESDMIRWGNSTEVKHKDLVGYIGSKDDFEPFLKALLIRNGFYKCKNKLFLTDGATWILPFLKEHYPGCVYILDKWHAKENAGKFAHAVKRGKKQKEAFTQKLFDLIDQGDVETLLKELEPYKNFKATGVVQFYDYVNRLKDCMHYDQYEAKGFCDGSGQIESAHRYTVQDRMKQSGQHWKHENGQGILSMKARKESNKWSEVVQLIKEDYIKRRTEKANRPQNVGKS